MLDFDAIRAELAALYSHTGRPSVDPELMLRTLLMETCIGFGIVSGTDAAIDGGTIEADTN